MTNQRRPHIVLLTTWYPPLQGVAVNRMAAFARYLDHSKYRLTVVTLGDRKTFGKTVENGVEVFRVKPGGRLMNPQFRSSDPRVWHYAKVAWRKVLLKIQGDEKDSWIREAVRFVRQMPEKPDVLISSFSPAAPHLAALELCKETGARWIADMRDEMSLNPQSDPATRKYYEAIEKEIALHASAVTSVSQPIVDYFRSAIPGLNHYVEIRNGFDHEMTFGTYPFGEPFTLLHAGNFYGTRKPDTLMAALASLHRKGDLPAGWQLICAGAVRNFRIPDAIKDHVVILERVSQEESLELMRNADLNVLIQPPTGRKGVYTGKLFDYLSVLKPILALVDETDVAAALIRETRCGYTGDFYDVEAAERNLLDAIRQWEQRVQLHPDVEAIGRLHRKYQVDQLNLLIETLLNEN